MKWREGLTATERQNERRERNGNSRGGNAGAAGLPVARGEPGGKKAARVESPNTKEKKMNDAGKNGADWWPPRVKKGAKIDGRPGVDPWPRDPEDYTSIPIAGQHPIG